MPKKILLFIPGYYGSRLKDEAGVIRWANASNFLFSQHAIATDIPGTTIGSKKRLFEDGLLTNVKVVHKLWDIDAYGVTIRQLKDFAHHQGMQLEVASFDWRDDFINCINTIDQKIKSFNLDESDELNIVAHSMGGLLMSYYIRYGTQDVESDVIENWAGMSLIKKLVLVAPPLHGLMILFRDISEGTRLGFNRELLSARDYSTFKSSYFFLPPKGEDIGINEKGEHFSLGIHDINKWMESNWGPFKFAASHEIESTRAFVEKQMHRSERFHELLRAKVSHEPTKRIKTLHLRGLGHKTLELAKIKIKNGRIDYVFGKEGKVDGDGTVTAKSGAPLTFFRVLDFKSVDSTLGHLDILAKSDSQKLIQNFLRS